MSYTDIIDNGRLVYSSLPSDSRLRDWPLSSIQLGVSYYKEVALSPIDKLVCGLLLNAKGKMSKKELGLTLGFDIASTVYQGQAFYTDIAEVEMHQRLLKQLVDWHLIVVEQADTALTEENTVKESHDDSTDQGEKTTEIIENEDFVRISTVGRLAIEKGYKFSFFRADMALYVNLYSTSDKSFDYAFPYLQELGVTAKVLNITTENINPDTIDIEKQSEWKDRLLLQLSSDWNELIYGFEPQNKTLPMAHTNVDFKLFDYNGGYKLLVYKHGSFCKNATDIINAECNLRALNYRIKKCLYYKLINDKNASFIYDEVISFWDNLEKDEYNLLLKDQRVNWTDFALFDLIVSSEYCTTQTWTTISDICPTEVIKLHLEKHLDDFNWLKLSRRMDVNYILSVSSHPWDYAVILGRSDIATEQAQQIFLLPSTKDTEWDWELVEKFVTIDFIKKNIDSLNIDFHHLTSWLRADDIAIILKHPSKPWNWDKATQVLSLKQIADNLSTIDNYINIYYLLDRCFANEANVQYTLQAEHLKHYFTEAIKNDRLRSFSLKEKSYYIWSDRTIAYFESIGLLIWESKLYEKGFVQYSFVKWTPEFFGKYYHKLTGAEDKEFVSGIIDDMSLISLYPEFKWDWAALSTNPTFANSEDFIIKYADNIDIAAWSSVAKSELIEKYFEVLHIDRNLPNSEVTAIISSKVSKDFIKHHADLAWENWAFTLAMCSGCEIDSQLVDRYHSHWDWNLLSSFASDAIVLENASYPWKGDVLSKAICSSTDDTVKLINEYKDKLDWDIVSSYIRYADFEAITKTYADKWNWWTINKRFTPYFTPELLRNEAIQDYIDWKEVSQQVKLENLAAVITSHPDKINWEYITQRLCSTMTIDILLEECNIPNWNWDYLTHHIDASTLKGGLQYSKLQWDWQVVTQRVDSSFILDNLVAYQDQWDWDVVWETKLTHNFVIDKIQQVAKIINKLSDYRRASQWSAFTKVLCEDEIFSLVEQYLPVDGYYWDYGYVYNNIQDITDFVSQPHSYIDWSALSCSDAANRYFHYAADIFDIRIWKAMAKKRLEAPLYKWDYKSLTKLENIQKGYQIFFKINTDAWNWDYISAEGYCLKAANNGEANLRKYKGRINFALLSNREDIELSEELIQSFIDEGWDWRALSSNKSIKITIRFVSDHKDKDWDWTEISRNSSIKWESKIPSGVLTSLFSNKALTNVFDWETFVSRTDISFGESLVKAIRKYIQNHWTVLSANRLFTPSSKLLSIAKEDGVDLASLDWKSLSTSKYLIPIKKQEDGHSSSDFSFVKEYADYLDWTAVTQNPLFDIYNDDIVDEYKEYLDWNFISYELESDKLGLGYLCFFKEYLNWNVINKRIDYSIITEDSLEELQDYLDWTKVSNLNLKFTERILSDFSDKWDWSILQHNEAFTSICTEEIKQPFKKQLNVAAFIDRFGYSSPKIYHFTHLFNVIEVLKSRKILSRNRAKDLGLLKFDSAGRVVGRTSKAHPYARFYYRTQTPTQFYNECLGWDIDLMTNWSKPKSYYSQALNLGLPKCPIPVFLEFDLQEVLLKNPHNCYYSNGNMQTNWASVYKVENSPFNLKMDGLYSHEFWEQYVRDNSQQEFLVKDEFDFSNINSIRIHCYDDETASLLRMYLGGDPIADCIEVGGCFSHNNRDLSFNFDEDELLIHSNYNGQGDAYFLVKGQVNIVNQDAVKRQTSEGIIVYPTVVLKQSESSGCEVHFIDQRARTTDWLIYKMI